MQPRNTVVEMFFPFLSLESVLSVTFSRDVRCNEWNRQAPICLSAVYAQRQPRSCDSNTIVLMTFMTRRN